MGPVSLHVSDRRRYIAVAAALGATILSAPAASASAGRQSGSGTMYLAPPSALLFSRQVGPDTIAAESGVLTFTGGTILGTGTITVTALVSPGNPETYVARWSGASTVDGRSGTLTMYFQGMDDGHYSGSFVVDGSGGLSGLLGYGTYSGVDQPGTGTYSVSYIN